jgi:hypothetical protein
MIVIKATGKADVKSLRKLASELSAEEIDTSASELQPVMPKRSRRPSVSTLPGATISRATQAAILELRAADIASRGEYELG